MRSLFAALVLLGLGLNSTVRADIDFYLADGNGGTEDHIIRYNGSTQVSSAPIFDGVSTYGFPGDFTKVGNTVYGVDQSNRRVYTLNPNTGAASQVVLGGTGLVFHQFVTGLAHQPSLNRLYYAASTQNALYRINTSTLTQSLFVGTNAILGNVRALAFNPSDNKLYAYSATNNAFVSITTTTGPTITQLSTPMTQMVAGHTYEALQFVDGQLYGLSTDSSTEGMIRKIDLVTGAMTNMTSLITGISPHAMLIAAVPEPSLVPIFGILAGAFILHNRLRKWWSVPRS